MLPKFTPRGTNFSAGYARTEGLNGSGREIATNNLTISTLRLLMFISAIYQCYVIVSPSEAFNRQTTVINYIFFSILNALEGFILT